MSLTPSGEIKLVFWPMAGSAEAQVTNLLHTLQWIRDAKPSRKEVHEWLKVTFGGLSEYFARNVYTVLLSSPGLVEVKDGKCCLTRDGYAVLTSPSTDYLLEVFARHFVGIAEILEILQAKKALDRNSLTMEWFTLTSSRFPQMKGWNARHISNQLRERLDWLRSLGFVDIVDGQFLLTAAGRRFAVEHPPELILLSPSEIEAEEKAIRSLLTEPFNPFDTEVQRVQSSRQAFVRDQGFRAIVVPEYAYSCAVCGFCLSTPRGIYEIEAAHIVPKSQRGSDHPRNGIALCGIHHWAFDKGVISVAPNELTVLVAAYLKSRLDEPSVKQIVGFEGQPIRRVVHKQCSPAPESLEWHNRNVFLG
jgi:hypothetical protein